MTALDIYQVGIPSRDEAIYTSCYCEENIWKLCEWIKDHKLEYLDQFYAVFISNASQKIPIWMQQAGDESTGGLVVWDYHVILIGDVGNDREALVYDLDTRLPFPCTFSTYIEKAIRSDISLREEFHRKFRVIPSQEFLEKFASDRSRMKQPDGTWIKEPPNYPSIQTKESTNNLDNFISMEPDDPSTPGTIFNFDQFIERFTKKS